MISWQIKESDSVNGNLRYKSDSVKIELIGKNFKRLKQIFSFFFIIFVVKIRFSQITFKNGISIVNYIIVYSSKSETYERISDKFIGRSDVSTKI